MVVKFTDTVADIWQLEEYHEFVRTSIDLSDYASLCDNAWTLKALANNRTFLARALNQELRTYLDGGRNHGLSAYSIILFNTPSYTIRANIWAPLDADAGRQRLQANTFSYFAYHDHNFHLVTAGYLGSGYRSMLYRHDFEGSRGELRSAADLHYVNQVRLGQGDVMTYRAFVDVHAQLPPEEVSISLNLMAHPPEFAIHPQFFFDMDSRTIATAVCDGHQTFGTYITMAQHVGDGNTVDLLATLARKHAADAIRETALKQLLLMRPGDADHFLSSLTSGGGPRLKFPAG